MLHKYWYHHFYKLVTILSPKYSVTNYFVIELTLFFSVKNQRHRKFSVIVFINESPIFPRNFWCQTNLSPNETIRPLMAAWKWRRPYRPCSPCHGPPHHPTPLQPSHNLLARVPLIVPHLPAPHHSSHCAPLQLPQSSCTLYPYSTPHAYYCLFFIFKIFSPINHRKFGDKHQPPMFATEFWWKSVTILSSNFGNNFSPNFVTKKFR